MEIQFRTSSQKTLSHQVANLNISLKSLYSTIGTNPCEEAQVQTRLQPFLGTKLKEKSLNTQTKCNSVTLLSLMRSTKPQPSSLFSTSKTSKDLKPSRISHKSKNSSQLPPCQHRTIRLMRKILHCLKVRLHSFFHRSRH